MKLPIADCRLPIAKLAAGGGFTGGGHNCCEVVGFLQQSGELAFRYNSRFNEQFEPQSGFIGFFFDRADLGDEFRFASGATCCPIIGGHRCAAADNLFGNDSSSIIALGNCSGEFDNPKRKSFGALFEFRGIHTPNLRNQSPIANRQPAISL